MATYDAKGNILTKGMSVVHSHIIQVASLTPYLPLAWQMVLCLPPTQVISYTSFKRPNAITQDGNVASFTYNGNQQRVKMQVAKGGSRL